LEIELSERDLAGVIPYNLLYDGGDETARPALRDTKVDHDQGVFLYESHEHLIFQVNGPPENFEAGFDFQVLPEILLIISPIFRLLILSSSSSFSFFISAQKTRCILKMLIFSKAS
jgi:hypothetical protein